MSTKTVRHTLESAREALADLIDRYGLPLPDSTELHGRVLHVRLTQAADIAPWSEALRAKIHTGRESDPERGRRWSLHLGQSDVVPGLWVLAHWQGPWSRVGSTVDTDVEGYRVGSRQGGAS